MIAKLSLLWSMCWFEAQRFRAYPHEIAAGIASRVFELGLYATFWLIVAQYAPAGTIDAWDILSYYMIISGLTPFFYAGFGIGAQTIDLIKSGQLSQTLIRPVNPIIYPWALRTGRNMINLAFGLVQIIVGVAITGGMKAEALPFLLPVLLNTAALNAAFNIFIGASAFYFTDARGLKNTLFHIAHFLRGDRMPLHLMTPVFINFLMLTPFPASMYHLTILLQGNRLPVWNDVLVGCVWSVVLLFAAVRFWRAGLKHYEAVGI